LVVNFNILPPFLLIASERAIPHPPLPFWERDGVRVKLRAIFNIQV
jgi:hypothetical protein